MIFFGQKAKVLGSESVPAVQCENCSSTNTTHIGVGGKYFHLYWIPVFPTGKWTVGTCTNCKHVTEERQMSSQMGAQADDLKRRTKTPVWFFSGLMLIGGITLMGSIFSGQDDAADRKSLAAPTAGDKYHIKTEDRDYTILKVSRVVGDTVYCLSNNYAVNKITGLRKIDKEENYDSDSETGFLKQDLQKMYSENQMIEVEN